ncbi:hypothetical protein LEMA_P027010.1 [Plenodomus lingam JN3]|uniref:GRF-type domain-containing protein n=1 Tax=Leptosphaeria maculans (strain JN3 / isolate v23.1.3 / race Av1-4-5-6-7-8) TaxID=985895 RepID=E4ZVC3_LEPMJ|nr:hypothetical protein LEMA_P027010.1 [Plenodomus lingam JN3]CBX95549.1 hypothetical protein LEMA_P027010.1 [Plenodomus lingam JN3]
MSGFRGRGRGRGGGAAATGPPKGLFINGIWHCDCNPREPAIHFETKKAGPNKGRWFRSCQKPDGARCGFFLWDDQAQPREQAVLMNNSRTEPSPITPSKRQQSPPPPYTVEINPSASNSRKRPRSDRNQSDEYGLEQADDDFNTELNQVMTEVETPNKAAKTSSVATPSRRKLPWQPHGSSHGLQTPQTDRKASGDASAFSKSIAGRSLFTPSEADESDSHQAATSVLSCETPTPVRFKNVGVEDLVGEVLALLRESNTQLKSHTESDIRALLAKHSKSAEGYKRGRDVLRTTIKAKDAKITELNFRINTLEAELEAEKAMVKHLQWEAQGDVPNT